MNRRTKTGKVLLQPSGLTYPQTEVSVLPLRGSAGLRGAEGRGACAHQDGLVWVRPSILRC